MRKELPVDLLRALSGLTAMAAVLLALSSCRVTSSSTANQTTIKTTARIAQLLDTAKTALAASKYEQAMDAATAALAVDSSQRIAHLYRGYAHFKINEYKKAIDDYDVAIKLAPDDYQGYEYRASAYQAERHYRRAISDFRAALQRAPANDVVKTKIMRELGLCQLSFGDVADAAGSFTQAIDLTPTMSSLYVARAIAELHLNEQEKCIADASVAIQLDPQDAAAYYARSHAYGKMGLADLADADDRSAKRLFASSYPVTAQ